MPKSPPEKLAAALRANLKRRKQGAGRAPKPQPSEAQPKPPPKPPQNPG